jgi:hypothetical protein
MSNVQLQTKQTVEAMVVMITSFLLLVGNRPLKFGLV